MWLISSWFILYACSIFGIVFGIQRLRSDRTGKKNMSIDELTVIIPFRNEMANLPAFLNCIYQQRYQPVQWIFVNDHSEDDFQAVFDKMKEFPIRLLHLPDDQRGKKRALRFGIDHATTDYCLTMDADVVFGKDYMKTMLVMPEAELVILPVEMTSTRWWHPFFTFEYSITSLLNRGVAGWSRPVNCSGANLLFKVSTFDELDDIEDHDHILSGDDMYTLRAFREGNKTIEIVENEAVKVSTPTPSRFSEVMDQRVRWMNKTGNVADNLNSFLGIWAVVIHLAFFLLLIIAFNSIYPWLVFVLLVLKGSLDFSLIRMLPKKWGREQLVGLFLFECLYPLYLFALLGSLLFSQPEWKGR